MCTDTREDRDYSFLAIASADVWPRVRLGFISIAVFVGLLLPLAIDPPVPFGAEIRQVGDSWLVSEVDSEGVAGLAGLQVGDVVVAVDGMPSVVPRRTDPGWDLRAAREITVTRQGAPLTVGLDWDHLPWLSLAQPYWLIAIAIGFWAIAVLAQLARPDDRRVVRFYWLNLVSAGALSLLATADNDEIWERALGTLALALVPALSLGFLSTMLDDTHPLPRLGPVANLLFVGGLVAGLTDIALGLSDSAWYDGVQSVLLVGLGLSFLGLLGLIVYLAWRQIWLGGPVPTPTVYLGIALALAPVTALVFLPSSIGLAPLVRPELAVATSLVLPVCFAHAMLRHRFLGVEVIVHRTLVYAVVAFFLAALYAVFLDALSLIGPGREIMTGWLLTLAFFALATLTFRPINDRARELVDRLLYRDRYDYARTLSVLSAQLVSVRPIGELLALVTEALVGAMNLAGAAVLVRQPTGELIVQASSGEVRAATEIIRRSSDGPINPSERTGHWIPLTALGEESGWLYLGPKRSPAGLSATDVSLAQTLASQIAVALANSLLIETLQARVGELQLLRDRLLTVQEGERKRLAQDLHDGAMHTVIDLVRQAEAIVETMPVNGTIIDDVASRLRGLVERGHDVAHELRAICSELYPSELAQLGLAPALQLLAATTSRDEDLIVHFATICFHPDQRLPRPIEDALYRLGREAIANVCRHAAAGAAWIELTLNTAEVTLEVRDDGQGVLGSTSPVILLRQGHLGLISLRERIEQVGGALEIHSTPGRGTRLVARIRLEQTPPSPGESASPLGALDRSATVVGTILSKTTA
jgi:two-component system sensor histidine kinase ComP